LRVQEAAVTVKLFATIKDVFRVGEIVVPLGQAADVAHLLQSICTSPARERAVYDDDRVLRKDVTVLVNGRHMRYLGGLQTKLVEGDDVRLFPPLYGG